VFVIKLGTNLETLMLNYSMEEHPIFIKEFLVDFKYLVIIFICDIRVDELWCPSLQKEFQDGFWSYNSITVWCGTF
jgi:hypothetical protein